MKHFKLLLLSFIAITALVVTRSFVFEKISSKSFYDFDEARYAEIAKNIFVTHQWLIPAAGGPDDPQHLTVTTLDNGAVIHPYFWKPPLHTWIIGLNYLIFDQNELAVRLPSLIFAFMSLILIYLISFQLFRSRFVSVLSVILFASTNDFSYLSSQGVAEMQLSFSSLASIYFLLKSSNQTHHRLNILLSGFFLGFAFMTKSFATFWIYPLSLAILHHQKTLNIKNLILWTIPQLIIILPWHLFMYQRFGQDFINNYLLTNTIGRGNGSQSNIAPIYWYVKYALWQWKTYLFVLPLLIWPLIKTIKSNLNNYLLLLVWMLLIFIPYSLIKSKVWWYVFPFWVPFTILIAQLTHFYYQKFPKITLPLISILIITTNILTINQTLTRGDWNQGIKTLASKYPNFSNLSVYKIPYESPLYYFNTGEIDRIISDKTKHIVTNKDYYQEITNNSNWQILDNDNGVYLLQKP